MLTQLKDQFIEACIKRLEEHNGPNSVTLKQFAMLGNLFNLLVICTIIIAVLLAAVLVAVVKAHKRATASKSNSEGNQ